MVGVSYFSYLNGQYRSYAAYVLDANTHVRSHLFKGVSVSVSVSVRRREERRGEHCFQFMDFWSECHRLKAATLNAHQFALRRLVRLLLANYVYFWLSTTPVG